MNRKPTAAAIETAINNGEKMFGHYDFTASNRTKGRFFVEHKNDTQRAYLVDTRPGHRNCECPQFEREGVCKHQWFVDENLRIAEEAACQQEYRDMVLEAAYRY